MIGHSGNRITRYPSMPVRWLRILPWSRSPLMRGSDRIEAVVRVLAVVLLLVAVPVAAATGTASYTAAADHIRSENSTKVAVQATLVADPVVTGSQTPSAAADSGRATTTAQAPVRWVRNGRAAQATVEVPESAVRGGAIGIWLGPDGRPTPAPTPSQTAGFVGFGAGFTLLAAIWAVVAGVLVALHWTLNRCHSAAWAREWLLVARPMGRDHR